MESTRESRRSARFDTEASGSRRAASPPVAMSADEAVGQGLRRGRSARGAPLSREDSYEQLQGEDENLMREEEDVDAKSGSLDGEHHQEENLEDDVESNQEEQKPQRATSFKIKLIQGAGKGPEAEVPPSSPLEQRQQEPLPEQELTGVYAEKRKEDIEEDRC